MNVRGVKGERIKTATTELNELILRDDGILVVRSINPDAPRTTELVEEMYNRLEEFVAGHRHPLLWDPRSIRSIRPGGWIAIVRRLEELFSAIGLMVNDNTRRLLAGYPDVWNSLLMPVRRFTHESEAIAWLHGFVESE